MPELGIGHSEKALFASDPFHAWVHGDDPGTRDDDSGAPRPLA